ncbi:hypothetical protein POM88_053613 [Heracleum sosnowskyi]|uniref:Uncharacterized protein n=1 Tax=Heracleum sosnowskyi TaxID=360622 RepID=A0AAD8GPY5_9APIA|nr:hypothetical protein POM88_053613 [Heracleum sosnowskyi]
MATTAFVSSGLEFVPNNYAAPLENKNAPAAFHLIQNFLSNSDVGTALIAPLKLSASQIRTFWQTGTYDNGGESGSPSIIFEFQGEEFVVTPTTVRDALGLEDFNAFTISVGDSELVRMMREIGYSGPLTKLGQLKRPLLRKEWSFFFDCITRAFGKKCTNWDAIPTDSLQIGYSLLYGGNFDVARLVLNNIGEKMTENRGVVYFARFCQLIFSECVSEVEIAENDVIPCFKLHKRIFSDLTNKDNKKGDVGVLMLPELVQQFLINSQQLQSPSNAEAGPSVSQPQRSKKSTVKVVQSGLQHTEAEASNVDAVPQRKRMKKRRAQRAKSVATDSIADSETETDEETLHQRKRRLVAAHLFGAVNITMDRVSKVTEAPPSENEEIVAEAVPQATPEIAVEEDIFNADEDRVFVNTETPEVFVQEDAANAEAVNLDRLNTDATMDFDAPTSKVHDVVEEAATHSDSRVFDREAHTSIYSDYYTEGVEADQVTDQVEESLATHTEVISCDLDKGEEVNQIQREAEVFAKVNSDIPAAVAEEKIDEAARFTAENILPENAADNIDEAGNDAEGSHSHPSIQVSLADDVNSDERLEVNRQTNEHFQNMYYKNWADADCIFSAQRAADLLSDSIKKISNTDVLTSLQATVVQVKSLNNRFDENQQMFTNLRNEFSLRDTTLKLDRSFYSTQFKQQAKDSEEIKKRLEKVEENQAEMGRMYLKTNAKTFKL